jgi:uncharacterized membrane protein YkvA (DUF1232 family)
MVDHDSQYLDLFPHWLDSLGQDAEALAELAADESTAPEAQRVLVAGLNALLKSIDLIPDGLQELGYVDDAFILRACVRLAVAAHVDLADAAVCKRLAADAETIQRFLGAEVHGRFVSYVKSLPGVSVRGRSADEIVGDDALLSEFVAEVRGFAAQYQSSGFGRDEKNLIRLRGFLDEATKSRLDKG